MYVYDITVTHCVVNRYNLCKTITARHTSHNFYLIAVFLKLKKIILLSIQLEKLCSNITLVI